MRAFSLCSKYFGPIIQPSPLSSIPRGCVYCFFSKIVLISVSRQPMTRLIPILLLSAVAGFSFDSPRPQSKRVMYKSSTLLKNDLRDEIESAAQRRAYQNRSKGDGVGETAAGAILGGLLGGPFGALVRSDWHYTLC